MKEGYYCSVFFFCEMLWEMFSEVATKLHEIRTSVRVHFACGQFDLRPCVISFVAADVRCDFVCD